MMTFHILKVYGLLHSCIMMFCNNPFLAVIKRHNSGSNDNDNNVVSLSIQVCKLCVKVLPLGQFLSS